MHRSLAGSSVRNRVAAAILNRLRKTIREEAVFRVVVIVPVHPEGTWRDNPSVRYIMRVRFLFDFVVVYCVRLCEFCLRGLCFVWWVFVLVHVTILLLRKIMRVSIILRDLFVSVRSLLCAC